MKSKFFTLLILLSAALAGCKKDFLDAKPDQSLVIPESLSDVHQLLDNYAVLNQGPFLTMASGDDLYATTAGYNGAMLTIRNSYIWAKDIYQGTQVIADWNTPYQGIYYTNVALAALGNLPESSETSQLKGQALFYRAMAYYQLAQEFTLAYNESTADKLPGLPLRLSTDIQGNVQRSTVRQTYEQITSDLNTCKDLLPQSDAYKTRPVRAAAYALLARVLLVMGRYQEAKGAADACLGLTSKLLDYNTLSSSATRPFPQSLKTGNDEIIFYYTVLSASFFNASTTSVDTALYDSYQANDLRKTLYFNNKGNRVITFKGNYTGNTGIYAGLTTDELYLTRAECYARLGDKDKALADLNTLLLYRWKKNTFMPLTAANADEALVLVLSERRKELVYRGMSWIDRKRLKEDSRFAKPMKRLISANVYVINPGDNRFALPFPDAEIAASGIAQNPR